MLDTAFVEARPESYAHSGIPFAFVLFQRPTISVGGVCVVPTIELSFGWERKPNGDQVRSAPIIRDEPHYIALGPLQGDSVRTWSGPCLELKSLSAAFPSKLPVAQLHTALEMIDRARLAARFRPDFAFAIDCNHEGAGCLDSRAVLSDLTFEQIKRVEGCADASAETCAVVTGIMSRGEGWRVTIRWTNDGPSSVKLESYEEVIVTSVGR